MFTQLVIMFKASRNCVKGCLKTTFDFEYELEIPFFDKTNEQDSKSLSLKYFFKLSASALQCSTIDL